MARPPIQFEVSAGGRNRLIEVYAKVFRFELGTWGGAAGKGPGASGAPGGLTDGGQAAITVTKVDRLKEAAEGVREAGGEVLGHKHVVAGLGVIDYCRDAEGNVFGIMEAEAPAS